MTASRTVPPRGAPRVLPWLVLPALLGAVVVGTQAALSRFGPPGLGPARGVGDGEWTVRLAYDLNFLGTGALYLAAVAALVALASAAVDLRRRGMAALAWLAALAGGFALLVETGRSEVEVRRRGFADAADRMAPLVAAIERFERERGRAPGTLAELVPAYLPDVRGYGVRGCRELEYTAWDARWELTLDCPNGLLTLDRFAYPWRPDAPRRGSVERIGRWAYHWD